MMKKTTILLVMVLAIAFLGFAVLGFGLPKDQKAAGSTATSAPPPAQKQPVATQAPRLQPVYYDDATADINRTTPQVGSYRGIGAQRMVTAGVPYVLVSTGHPETAGGNSHMRRQVKSSASGVVHMVYRVFDADTANVVQTTADSNRNGFYFYNAYDCGGSNALRNGRLAVPMQQVFGGGDTRPRKLQLGGIFVKPSNAPVVYGNNFILREDLVQAGRYDGSPQTLGVMKDGAECTGLFSMDTSQTNTETRLNHPVMHAVNESTYFAVCYRTNFPNLGRVWRTTNRGLTWTGPTSTGTAAAWYGSFELTGVGNTVYILSMTDPNDLTAFVTTERPVYSKITYDPITGIFSGIGNPPTDIGALSGYSNPAFLGCMTDIAGTMVGETLHVAWMTWNNWLGQQIAGPGGEVLHAQVFPDESSPSVDKIADVNIDGRLPKITTTLFGFGSLPWSQIELSYDVANSRLYCQWVQPVPDANPNDANYDWGDYEATGTLAVDDIFMSVSPNNGRGWDEPQNVTQTNNPGCDGSVGDECQHEYWFSCDDRVNNDTIYTVALVNKYPGIQEAAIASQITPDVGPQTAYRDEFRLYKVPARAPVLAPARGAIGPAIGDTVAPYNLKLTPGSLVPYVAHMRLRNIGLLGFITDSIKIGADLSTGGLTTTSNFSAGNPVAVGGGYNFNVSFDVSAVTPAQAGAHSGLVQVFGHSNSPASNVVVGQAFNAYIIPTLCLNRKMQIHSASNQTDIGSQGTVKDAGGVGMAYPAIPNRDNFYDGGVWIANSGLVAAEGVAGVPRKVTRQLFADKFLRCLSDIVLDSTLAPGGSYNLSLASIATDVEDSTVVYKNIWEQSTHADSSDFMLHTVKVINIGSTPIDSVAMGNVYDIDVASDISSPAGNVSGDTSVSFLGRKFWVGWTAGNDVAIDTCSPNSEMYGVVIIPGSIGNPGDSIHPHGAVMYDQSGFSYNTDNANEAGGDSLCQRYMWNLDVCTSTRRRTHDSLTGVWQDTVQPPPFFVCDADVNLGAPYRGDEGYLAVAKKVYNLPVNTGGGALVARYGLSGLVAGTDEAFKGLGETFTVIHLASNSGMADLMLNAQKGIDWYVKHANLQAGPYQDVSLRGDFNNDHLMTGADVVSELNRVYLGTYTPSPFSNCVADVNLDGNITSSDYVLVLNITFLGPPNCPWCLTRCP